MLNECKKIFIFQGLLWDIVDILKVEFLKVEYFS